MAEVGTWPSIRKHGLLSTTALLDLFEISGAARFSIESTRRRKSVVIAHAAHGTAVIRDQKPMSDGALGKCLVSLTPRQWYELLNRKVFFWVDRDRLLRLLTARAYRRSLHCVLTFESERILDAYRNTITLSPINSGSTILNAARRGPDTFRNLRDYPGHSRVVELAVEYKIPNASQLAKSVQLVHGEQVLETLYEA